MMQVPDIDTDSEYVQYMRTDVLLTLQRSPAEQLHHDELLFQVTHQSSELWLHLAGTEAATAVEHIRAGRPADAERLLRRASLAVSLCTKHLDMLRHLAPAAFAVLRPALGEGSGSQSPGWHLLRRNCRALSVALDDYLAARGIDLPSLYRGSPTRPLYQLAEGLIDLDEQVTLWRTTHYKIASRIIGSTAVGTAGTPVDVLAGLIHNMLFPKLWRAREDVSVTTRIKERGDQ